MSSTQIRKISAVLQSSYSKQPINQRSQYSTVAKKQQSFRINYGLKEGTKTSSKAGYESVSVHDAINAVVYGEKIIKYSRNGRRKHVSFFFLHESDNSTLQWLSHQKKYADARIKLSSIKNISSEPHALKIAHLDLSVSLCLFLEGGKELVLQFHESHLRDLWWKGLLFLREYWLDLDLTKLIKKESMVGEMLLVTDIDKKKKFGEKEVKKIIKKLLISIRGEELEQKAASFYKDKEKLLSYDDLVDLLLLLLEKQEIQPIFQKYCINDQMILYKEVQRFFADEQGEDLDEKLVLARMNRLYRGSEHKIVNYLSFCQLIFTSENSIFDPKKLSQMPSFDRPLSDYFVHSSFRSYLAYDIATFNIEPTRGYIYLLQKGVRQFDLFCIDGENGEPEVKQGAAQVIKASFSEILKAVKATAFERSPHPVIIDLDHECSLQQQDKMAEIIGGILGDLLYKLPEDFLGFKYLPSPEQLKKKIVLRAKGRLANIISMYEKSVAKRVKQKEEKELENKKNKFIQQQDNSGKMIQDNSVDKRRIANIDKKNKTVDYEGKKDHGYQSNEGGEDEDCEEYDDQDQQYIQQKGQSNKRRESSSNKKRKLQQFQQQHTTAKELSSTGKSIASGINNSSFKAGSGGKGESEIEQLIDLELNLDKEYLNDDNYAIAKSSQITLFNFQQNKTIITANREYKSMINMQQNSQYSLVENPKEALQRKMRSDQQQYSFFEVKSPSLISQQSNKQRRHTTRSSSFKQLPHLEIAFKSDVPIHEYHGSQQNVPAAGKEDSDSPAFSKHPNPADKKRQSLLYLARKRASIENIQPIGSLINNTNIQQANESSQKDILQNLQNGSFYMQDSKKQGIHSSSSSDNPDEMLSQAIFLDNSKATGVNGEELLPQNSGLFNGPYNFNADAQSQRQQGQEVAGGGGGLSIMQSSFMQPDSKNLIIGSKQKIVIKNSQFANIANSLEKCTALFACKFKQQQDLSIWSCSQLSVQKITAIVQRAMLEAVDDNAFNLLQHTRQYLLRVQPKFQNNNNKGDQQNFDFIQTFCAGCQFSGQNYAIQDHFLLAYTQFFRQNGSSGLVLKPPWLLSDSHCDGAAFYEKEAQRPKLWVKIEVISAMSLRVPTDEEKKIVPWIAIRLIGTPIDVKTNDTAFTSSDSPSSSFNPQFDSLISDFTVHLPQFAFIYFQVFESKENPVQFAQYVIPVSCIRKGFRTVPLLDAQHKIIPNSFLFVHVTIEELTQQQQDISILNPNRQQNVTISSHEGPKTPPLIQQSISIKNISSTHIFP